MSPSTRFDELESLYGAIRVRFLFEAEAHNKKTTLLGA